MMLYILALEFGE